MAVGFSSLKIHDEATYDFVADVFGELAAMTPGPVPAPRRRRVALGTDPEDFAVFVARASEIIADLGKTPVAWHEAGAAAGLADTTIGQYWGFLTPPDGMDDKARAFVDNGGAADPLPRRRDLPRHEVPDDGPELGPHVGERPDERRARLLVGARRTSSRASTTTDILGVEAPLWTETIRTARRHRHHGLPAHRRRRRGRLVAGDRRQRPAHLGVLP